MSRKQLPARTLEKVSLLASKGKRQTDIAKKLAISEPTVHRLLGLACKSKLLEFQPPQLNMSKGEQARLENEIYGRDALFAYLQNRSDGVLKHLAVFDTHAGGVSELATAGAGYIVERVFSHAKVVALTWGHTIRELVAAIRDHVSGRRAGNLYEHRLKFVQACGDPQAAVGNPSLRSSNLVATLSEVINGEAHSTYTFSMSASIPHFFKDEEVATIREFIRCIGGYSEIFDDRQRLAIAVDTLITSCGIGRLNHDRWLTECAEVAGIPEQKLESLTVGNIGGYWLPRKGLNKTQEELLKKINESWNGIVLEDIKLIARRRPGVILVAEQEHKAEIVVNLVKEKLVSVLLISDVLAAGIEKIRDSQAESGSRTKK